MGPKIGLIERLTAYRLGLTSSLVIALTRPVAPSMAECELTHLERQPIDIASASRQHDEYENVLRALGCKVTRLAGLPGHPDSVFIEDTAIVLDECAVITRPGAESRRGEVAGVAEALERYRRLYHIEAPGTLDGGDVLRVRRRLYVGVSARSNADGARQLADAVAHHGYSVARVPMRDCLHLKTAVSTLPDHSLLLNPRWVDAECFDGARAIEVHPEEPEAANVLVVGATVVLPASARRTREALEAAGYRTVTVDGSELAKAEGGLTCCSLLVGEERR
jgi:dimethylargininase